MKAEKILLSFSLLFIYINCDPCTWPNLFSKSGVCVTRDLCRFYSDYNCWDVCPSSTPYHNYGDKECISSCTGEYVYKNVTDKICYKKEQCTFIDISSPSNYLCYHDSCPSGKYHNFDSKICLDKCTGDRQSYAFGIFTCYSSCKDIPSGDYIYEVRDNTDNNNKCYRTKIGITCNYYYKKNDGVLKCVERNDCINMNYKYIIGTECRWLLSIRRC